VIIIALHDTRRLADRVDFITTPGYIDGAGARERWGLPAGTGPEVIITNKAVLRFDKATGEAYLATYHPDQSIDEVRRNTPWDLKVADDVHETEPPTAEELRVLREILDPKRMISAYERRGYV
jgi:glutaconate CoA-transferase subunit B